MSTELVMGNQAMALGAIRAGVQVVTGYPGTPSTEVLETIAGKYVDGIYVEWSVNEKVAVEIAAGAAYSGMRSLVTMKQMGLNVASDPVMCLSYVGIKGGMVILVADDPGPISSQTEQDTRNYAQFSKLPVFDPSTPEEAYEMMIEAFDYSEKYGVPVLFRPTTRVCHATASMEVPEERKIVNAEGFVKDSKWVIFPKLSYEAHLKIKKRNEELQADFSAYARNKIEEPKPADMNRANPEIVKRKGVAAGGISYAYAKEGMEMIGASCKLFKVTTPYPFPEEKAVEFLKDLDEVLVIEELDPVIERELTYICGKYHLNVDIKGKLTGHVQFAGENTAMSAAAQLAEFLEVEAPDFSEKRSTPVLPGRPPTLCAGCPHRASFYVVKKAMKWKKAVFTGDIGCYTLGNAAPLDMVDTCLCMGAGITVAQGIQRAEPDTTVFAFIGDSTFFHTGISGILDAVYNETNLVIIVLDNSTTAMTGHQPHPGTGQTMMGNIAEKISIPGVLKGLGVKDVQVVNPFDLEESLRAVKHAADMEGVTAVVFEAPCIAITKPQHRLAVDPEVCTGCKMCINQLGCPALVKDGDIVAIDRHLCYGCTICSQVCFFNAIGGEEL